MCRGVNSFLERSLSNEVEINRLHIWQRKIDPIDLFPVVFHQCVEAEKATVAGNSPA